MIYLDRTLTEQIETRLPNGDMSGIKLRDVRWSVKTAGPSPFDNERTELFLLGCNKAMSGNPCKGCFNSTTWDQSKALWSHDPIKMAEHINNNAPNKYITIGGGEPTDQIDNLLILCKELKKYGFHIMMYTWRDLISTLYNPLRSCEVTKLIHSLRELLNYVDIIIDGEYKEEERAWDGSKEDGLISSIGSGNQIVWNVQKGYGFSMRDIDMMFITELNSLQYILKDLDAKMHKINIKHKNGGIE